MDRIITVVAVFHGSKVEGVLEQTSLPNIQANPPMTIQGMETIQHLAGTIKAIGPYDRFLVSRMARALDTASVLALGLNKDFRTHEELGQHANKDGEEVIFYPGHEEEDYASWQRGALALLNFLFFGSPAPREKILIVSHRPVIGGLVAASRDIREPEAIKEIVRDPKLTRKGYLVFTYDGTRVALAEK